MWGNRRIIASLVLFLSFPLEAATPSPYAKIEFASETYRATDLRGPGHFPALLAGAAGTARYGVFEAGGEAKGYFGLGAAQGRYLNVPEAFVGTSGEFPAVQVRLGRKLQDWSLLDDHWRLGLAQPRFRWDYLDPEPVGLTGFFVSSETEHLRVLAFGSPFYIPELGATVDLKDGRATSPSPFVSAPPDSVPLFGQNIPIRYRLDPATSARDIVLHPSAGLLARIGGTDGAWWKASYLYQPMHRLLLGYEGYLDLPSQEIQVTLRPRVVYHHVAALEAGYAERGWRAWFSLLGERPAANAPGDSWTSESVSPGVSASATVDLDLGGRGVDAVESRKLSLSYLRTWGGVAPDEGPLAAAGRSAFESRYPYRNAASASARLPLIATGRHRFEAASRGIYELTVSGILLSVDLRYMYRERLALGLGGDALAASKESAPEGGADYFYLYRSDDRVRGKVSYLF